MTISGAFVNVEYATKHLRYENRGAGVWIAKNGGWEVYNPDEEYIVDMKEVWQTVALPVCNNDFERCEPYGDPFQPAGAGYMVTNEFEMVYLMYDDGSMVYLENHGDGAFLSTEATGYSLIQMRGEKSYYDSTNGFWWSYGWDNWSFSIDGGSTWTEAPSLEIRMVEDPAPDSFVGIFDGREWTLVDGRLEFLDENFPQVGWLGMDKFFYDLYDGVGYDGEPLRLTVQEIYEFEDDPVMDRWGHWPASGHEASSNLIQDLNVAKWIFRVYGGASDEYVAQFSVPNPSGHFDQNQFDEPLTVVFRSNDAPARGEKVHDWINEILGVNVLYHEYDPKQFSLSALTNSLQAISYALDQPVKNLVIVHHSTVGEFTVGVDDIHWYDLAGGQKYRAWFQELNEVLLDAGGQIQYYGCGTAGVRIAYNPDGAVPPNPDPHDQLGMQSWLARRMLSTIAELTHTTVFASSDFNRVVYNLQYGVQEIIDMCLMFGVSSKGQQVDYQILSPQPWSITLQEYDADLGVPGFGSIAVSTLGENSQGQTLIYEPFRKTEVYPVLI